MSELQNRLSPEFKLLASCCRWPTGLTAVEPSLSPSVNWQLFLGLVQRHRVSGLVNHAFAQASENIPAAVLDQIASVSKSSSVHSLRQAGEACRIYNLMIDAGVTPTFLKGSSLGVLAYGTLSIKAAYDIDILVRPDQLGLAFATLSQAGYVPTATGDLDKEALLRRAALVKDTVWRHAQLGFIVELHSRLFANEQLLTHMPSEPTRMVALGRGLSLPTFGPLDLLVYLAVHGAVHGWSRLKWLADFNALLTTSSVSLSDFLNAAAHSSVDRAAQQALFLSSEVLGSMVFDGSEAVPRGRLSSRLGAYYSLTAMTSSGDKELDEFALSTVKIQVAQFFVRRGWRYKLAEVIAKTRQVDNPEAGRIRGSALFFVALLRWLRRRMATKRQLSSKPH